MYFVVPMTFDIFGIDILTVKMRSTDYTRGARYSLLNRTMSRVPSRRISEKKKKTTLKKCSKQYYQRVHVVLRRQEYATVEPHGGGYRVFAVSERHPLAVGFHLHYPQVLHGMSETAFLVRSHLYGFRGRVDGQP